MEDLYLMLNGGENEKVRFNIKDIDSIKEIAITTLKYKVSKPVDIVQIEYKNRKFKQYQIAKVYETCYSHEVDVVYNKQINKIKDYQ